MQKFMKYMAAGVLAIGSIVGAAQAATLNGTFTIDIRNFTDPDVTNTNSFATAANFGAQASDAVITYTGDINFFNPTSSGAATSIAQFLGSAGGSYSIVSGTQSFLDSTRLSQGSYVTTTLFSISGVFATAVEGIIRHDDGITLVASGQTGGVSAPPTPATNTAFTANAGEFTLFYAAANGNPSILNVDAAVVPLPAAGFLLIGALGGLVALRRRKTA
jgi:hypothetical protein